MAWRGYVAGVLVVVPLSGCGSEISRPFSAPSPLRTAAGVLTIDGPPQIQPSATGSFRAWLNRAGQPAEDVTARATWRSTNSSVATVAAGGVVTAGAIGETVIEALLDGRQIGRAVRVVPDGTFALNGTVRPFFPQLRARVEVTGGAGPPVSAETNELGVYRLLGVGGRVRVTARMDGFAPRTSEIDVGGDTVHDVSLSLNAEGRPWKLTVTAGPECAAQAGAPPPEFAADVAVLVRAPVVLLSPVAEPTLGFYGRLESDRLTMLLAGRDDGFDYYPPGVEMRSASGAATQAIGMVHATASDGQFAGRMEGYLSGLPAAGAFCYSEAHQLTLRQP